MLHTSTQKLIQKICELTESGDIAWKEAPEGRCRFDTEGYQIEVAEEPPLVRLMSPEGRELEKAEAADLAIAWPDGNGTFATHVADMARRAHRVARGAEQAISKILSSLSAPPKKAPPAPEPEPAPASIEFEPQVARKPQPVSAAESRASIAALNADMVSQRRQPEPPPPAPHTPPAPQPVAPPQSASTFKTETSVGAVLSVESSAPEAEPAIAAAEEKLPLEDAPPLAPPKVELAKVDPPRVEPPRVEPAPIQPVMGQSAVGQPVQRAPSPPQEARPAFGGPVTFAQPQRPAPPQPSAQPGAAQPPKPASSLFSTGFSAVPRPAAPRPEPQPTPPPAPTVKAAEPPAQQAASTPSAEPARVPETTAPATPPRTGKDIYKPW